MRELVVVVLMIVLLVAIAAIGFGGVLYFNGRSNQFLYEKMTGETISLITAANLPANYFTRIEYNQKEKYD